MVVKFVVGTAGTAGGSEGTLWLLKGMYWELLNLGQFKWVNKREWKIFIYHFYWVNRMR